MGKLKNWWKGGIVILIILISSFIVISAPSNPGPYTLTQPDGTSFEAYYLGDEFFSWHETLDGYSIIQDKNEWRSYAQLDKENNGLIRRRKMA